MKRSLLCLLSLALLLAVSACGKSGPAQSAAPTASASPSESLSPAPDPIVTPSPDPAQTPAVTPAPAESPAASSGSSPSEKPAQSQKPAQTPKPQKPQTSKPPAAAPSPSVPPAASPSPAPSVSPDLAAFSQSLSDGGSLPAVYTLSAEELESAYPELSKVTMKQCVVQTPMISAVAFELALVEVEKAADAEAVKKAFQARVDYQIDQGAFYPATVEQWKNTARIVTVGSFVLLAVGDGAADIETAFRALF